MQRKVDIDLFNNRKEYDFFEFKLELIEMADNYWIYWNSNTNSDTWNDIDYEYIDNISYKIVGNNNYNENNKSYENRIDISLNN